MRVLVWVVSVVLIAGVGAFTLLDMNLRQKYEPTLGQLRKDISAEVGFFCEQQVKLSADPWFHEPRTPGDAGPLLNAWVPWDPSPPLPKGSPLTIPARLPQDGKNFGEWLTSGVDVSTLDFGWMRQLHAYDRWDILQNSPVPLPQRINWATMPIPHFVSLLQWGKFRLLHGLKTGQPTEAARDVRQLAWLVYRTETVLGGAVASLLLKFERQAYDSMKEPPADWHPMSLEQIERLRILIVASPTFSQLSTPLEVAQKARGCGEPVVTRCTALTEASFFAGYLQPLAKDQYADIYAALATERAERPCDTSLLPALWERGVTVMEENPERIIQSQMDWPNSLPGAYAKRHIVGILLSIGSPSLGKLKEFRADLESGKYEQKQP